MDAVDLAFAGIARQAELIAAGEVSSRELVELYLERIERYDGELNAFRVVLGERARLEADQADARASRRRARGRLLGVPVRDQGRHGRRRRGDGASGPTPTASRRARTARSCAACAPPGAIVLGKTNVPELCAFPWTESPTWGVTRNPGNHSTPREAPAEAARRRSRPGSWGPRWRPTAAGRSASRPPTAACSA